MQLSSMAEFYFYNCNLPVIDAVDRDHALDFQIGAWVDVQEPARDDELQDAGLDQAGVFGALAEADCLFDICIVIFRLKLGFLLNVS